MRKLAGIVMCGVRCPRHPIINERLAQGVEHRSRFLPSSRIRISRIQIPKLCPGRFKSENPNKNGPMWPTIVVHRTYQAGHASVHPDYCTGTVYRSLSEQ
jgi:hypothetical protein